MSDTKETKTAKVDTASDEFKAAVQAAVNASLASILPQIVAGVQTGQASAIIDAHKQREAASVANSELCHDCKQLKIACKGEHIQAVVFPAWAHPTISRWYRGQWVNGVNYRSRGPGHFITIPKNSNIMTEMHKWTRAEEDLQFGRAAGMGLNVNPGQPLDQSRGSRNL